MCDTFRFVVVLDVVQVALGETAKFACPDSLVGKEQGVRWFHNGHKVVRKVHGRVKYLKEK